MEIGAASGVHPTPRRLHFLFMISTTLTYFLILSVYLFIIFYFIFPLKNQLLSLSIRSRIVEVDAFSIEFPSKNSLTARISKDVAYMTLYA